MKPRCRAYDFRVDVVGIKLLDSHKSQYNQYAVNRTAGEKGYEEGRYHSEKGSEVWNNVQKSSHNSYDYCKFYMEKCQNQGRKESDDKAVHKSSFNKCCDHRINLPCSLADNSVSSLA